MGNWKCISTLRGDGTPAVIEATPEATNYGSSPSPGSNSRFLKTGAISSGKDVVWH